MLRGGAFCFTGKAWKTLCCAYSVGVVNKNSRRQFAHRRRENYHYDHNIHLPGRRQETGGAMTASEIKQANPLDSFLEAKGIHLHGTAPQKTTNRCAAIQHKLGHLCVSVDTAKGIWHCNDCDTGGTVIDWMMIEQGKSLADVLQSFNGAVKSPALLKTSFDWPRCVAALTAAAKRNLADWRGLSPDFIDWLHREKVTGIYKGKIAFAVRKAGQIVGCHYLADRAEKLWFYYPKGNGTHPLIFGDPGRAVYVLCFESQWDAFAVMDKLGWHLNPPADYAVFITRGADNGKLIKGQCASDAAVFAFAQNDKPDEKGKIAAEIWLADVASYAGRKVLRVATPAEFKDANDWTRAGATKADFETAIRAASMVQPPPETDAVPNDDPEGNDFAPVTAWIRGQILESLQDDETPAAVKNSAVAGHVVTALARIGRFYFHEDLKDFDSAMFFDGNRKRLERIRGDSFAAWLADWLMVNRATGLFKFILAAVETAALSGSNTTGILPESYWAARPGAFYLSNGDGSAAKITAGAVCTVDNGADGVLFAAGKTLAPWTLTEPSDVFESCALFRNAHCGASHGKLLLQLWLYSFATMPRSKPPLGIIGEIGAGKTRTAKAIAELYGIPFRAAKVEEGLESNFWPNVNEGGLLILDNADSKCRWLADAVASAATDGSSQRRKLYTNSETVLLRANAWLAVTSANPTFGNDAGLADRLLICRMERRADETGDGVLTDEILASRDAGLSHIAHTLRKALADTGPTPAKLNERHPDFAVFAVKIGRALGRETEAIQALRTAEADKSAFCLENDTIGAALLAHLNGAQSFTGTAAELALHLITADKDLEGRLSAKRLGKRLSALWPHLKKAIATARKETNRNGVTVFTFKADGAGFAGFQTDFSQNP